MTQPTVSSTEGQQLVSPPGKGPTLLQIIAIIITHADGINMSKVFSGVSDCLHVYVSVCLSVCMIKPKWLNLHSLNLPQG